MTVIRSVCHLLRAFLTSRHFKQNYFEFVSYKCTYLYNKNSISIVRHFLFAVRTLHNLVETQKAITLTTEPNTMSGRYRICLLVSGR